MRELAQRLDLLEEEAQSLRLQYRRAGASVRDEVDADISFVREAKEDAERLISLLRGGALFGRYSSDADHHLRVADRLRVSAMLVLVCASVVGVALKELAVIRDYADAIVLVPFAALFLYLSIESHNHRRREFDRRRIALRMQAIEVYTQRRTASEDPARASQADDLLDEFIRQHFIEPELDSNDMTFMGPKLSFVTLFHRK